MMTPEQQAEFDRRVQKSLRLQRDLQEALDQAQKQIDSIRKDSEAGCNPRYHKHLLSTVLELNDTAVRLLAVCEG